MAPFPLDQEGVSQEKWIMSLKTICSNPGSTGVHVLSPVLLYSGMIIPRHLYFYNSKLRYKNLRGLYRTANLFWP